MSALAREQEPLQHHARSRGPRPRPSGAVHGLDRRDVMILTVTLTDTAVALGPVRLEFV